jgi:hypothetical protein
LILLFVILAVGTIGFSYLHNVSFITALHNSAMYLSSIGYIIPPKTNGQKLFSTFYGLTAAILFLSTIIYVVDRILALEIA